MPISMVWLTSSLLVGGAQMMLYKLLSHIDRSRFTCRVISLTDLCPMKEKFEALGVPVSTLGMQPGIPNPVPVLRLAKWLRENRPDVMQTWMYHADLVGGLAAKLAGDVTVAWGVRHSNLSREGNRWLTLQTVKACARMSHWIPRRIVCNSEASCRVHTEAGYATAKMTVIHNGSDLSIFKPNPAARLSVRQYFQIPQDAPLIGLVGRWDPLKDHRNFLQAAALLHRDRPNVHFLLCGDGVTWENPRLSNWIAEGGIASQCRLLGRREDIPRLTASFDIAACSSFGESFANVIGEAMSCAVPCVVTDVGDSAIIVGETGRVVPAKDPKALSSAFRELVDLKPEARRHLGGAARQRVQEKFDLPVIVKQYESLYEELAGYPASA